MGYGRFAECFQFDVIFRGKEEQRRAVVESLTPEYGSNHHRLLQRLDRQVNQSGRHFLTIGFHGGMNSPGLASPAGFNLSAAMGYAGCYEVARHELGHLIDFRLITDTDREWFRVEMGRESWGGSYESFAEAVREWLDGGWQALTPILLPD